MIYNPVVSFDLRCQKWYIGDIFWPNLHDPYYIVLHDFTMVLMILTDTTDHQVDPTTITLTPMMIRTFICDISYA